METAAWTTLQAGDLDGAREQFTAMGDRARELGRLDRVTDATFGLAYVLARAEDYAAALELGIPVLDAYRAREDDGAILMTLEGCGWCSLALADPAGASSYFLEAIDIAERLDSPFRLTRIGAALGASLVFMGEEDKGTQLLAAATAADVWFEPPSDLIRDEAVRHATLALGDEAFAAAWARGEALTFQTALDSALTQTAPTRPDVKADERSSGSVASVLRVLAGNPELRRVELAYLTFTVAEWGTWLAMLVYAYDQGGTTEAGVLATVLLVPAAILAPVLGGLAERIPPGRSLVAGYTAQAVSCGVVAVAMLLGADRLVVYVLLFLPSIAYTMTRPAQASFAPGLARRPEHLAVTNVVSGWIESVSTLAGPLLVGVVLSFSAPDAVFAVGGGPGPGRGPARRPDARPGGAVPHRGRKAARRSPRRSGSCGGTRTPATSCSCSARNRSRSARSTSSTWSLRAASIASAATGPAISTRPSESARSSRSSSRRAS